MLGTFVDAERLGADRIGILDPRERPDGWADRIANTTPDQRQRPSPPACVVVGARCRIPARLSSAGAAVAAYGAPVCARPLPPSRPRRHLRSRPAVAAIGEPLPPLRHLFLIRTEQHDQVLEQMPDVRECQLDDMMRARCIADIAAAAVLDWRTGRRPVVGRCRCSRPSLYAAGAHLDECPVDVRDGRHDPRPQLK
jgi:hypothetical protein